MQRSCFIHIRKLHGINDTRYSQNSWQLIQPTMWQVGCCVLYHRHRVCTFYRLNNPLRWILLLALSILQTRKLRFQEIKLPTIPQQVIAGLGFELCVSAFKVSVLTLDEPLSFQEAGQWQKVWCCEIRKMRCSIARHSFTSVAGRWECRGEGGRQGPSSRPCMLIGRRITSPNRKENNKKIAVRILTRKLCVIHVVYKMHKIYWESK